MKGILNIINNFVKKEKKVLGRWNIESCHKKMNNKVDMSNEDHCGPCGQYILTKEQPANPNKNIGLGKVITKYK
jgi:hypothetical protein